MDCDEEGRFKRCFFSFDACRTAVENCQPVVCLDACHIRNKYKGVVLAACSIDGDGGIVPLAFGVAPIEDSENWRIFVNNLKTAIPQICDDTRPIIVISDREKGIYNAARDLLPMNLHRYCVKHIEKNLKTRFGINFQDKLWRAAKTLSINEFNSLMQEMQQMNVAAYEYLNAIDKPSWTRVHSTLSRYGHVTSNVAECFNSWILEARDSSHFGLVVMITRKIMQLFCERRANYARLNDELPRNSSREIRPIVQRGARLQCFPASSESFLVVGGAEYTVNLTSKICSCGDFKDRQFPCIHAAAAASSIGMSALDLVGALYKKPALMNVYRGVILPVSTSDLIPDATLPPAVQAQAGRPKKVRLRNRSELDPESSPIICSRCGNHAHNVRTCERRARGDRIERN
jgi:hypothetical protein